MKHRSLPIAAILFMTGVAPSQAAIFGTYNTLSGEPTQDKLYADASGNLMSSGIVTMGYFLPEIDVAANLDKPWLLASHYVILATATPGAYSLSLDGTYPGYAESYTSGGNILDGNPLIGIKLYSMVGNGQSISASDNIALVDLNSTIESDFPFERTYVATPFGRTILIGSTGSFTGNPAENAGAVTGTYQTLKLSTVPEPSAIIAGLLGILPLLRRRR
jgi:hypothetical protein